MASILFEIVRIFNSQFKCNYLKNEKRFLNFRFHFWNLHEILNLLKERMIVVAQVFPKLGTVKMLLTLLSEMPRFRTGFDSQQVKASKIPLKSKWEHFCHVFSSFSLKMIYKMSLLVLGEILVVFVNRLTADGRYSVRDCKNLQLQT